MQDAFIGEEVGPVTECIGPESLAKGTKVHKYGARTKYTQGMVTFMGDFDDGAIKWKGILAISSENGPICGDGDSGSVWVCRDMGATSGLAVGLHFGGSSSGTLAFAVPMWYVVEDTELNIRF